MNTSVPPPNIRIPVQRICSEYLEMPGLRLTNAQAQRLLGLEGAVCNDALTFLVDAGFLRRTPTGQYARVTDGLVVPPFRMAKVSFVQARTGQKVS